MLPDELVRYLDRLAPGDLTHVGFVAADELGQVLLAEPQQNAWGITATFPRLRREQGESLAAAVDRCLRVRVGHGVESAYPLGEVWKTPYSSTLYLAGLARNTGHQEHICQPTRWCSREEAAERFASSLNPSSRTRDLAMLQLVGGVCLSPDRRALLMVQELHRRGFERLRAATYIHSVGAWRCAVLPVTCIQAAHGAMADWSEVSRLGEYARVPIQSHIYSSACAQHMFQWDDAHFDGPAELADKFLERAREVAFAGWGPDPEYRAWFTAMLQATGPHGVIYADDESEREPIPDFLRVLDCRGVERFPLPHQVWQP